MNTVCVCFDGTDLNLIDLIFYGKKDEVWCLCFVSLLLFCWCEEMMRKDDETSLQASRHEVSKKQRVSRINKYKIGSLYYYCILNGF